MTLSSSFLGGWVESLAIICGTVTGSPRSWRGKYDFRFWHPTNAEFDSVCHLGVTATNIAGNSQPRRIVAPSLHS